MEAESASERTAFALIGVFSAVALGFLSWFALPSPRDGRGARVDGEPSGTERPLEFHEWHGPRGRRRRHSSRTSRSAHEALAHGRFHLGRLSRFLHRLPPFSGGHTFHGQGFVRPIYFFILITHILGSIAALPLVLVTLFLAATKRFPSSQTSGAYHFSAMALRLRHRGSRFSFPALVQLASRYTADGHQRCEFNKLNSPSMVTRVFQKRQHGCSLTIMADSRIPQQRTNLGVETR